MLVLLNNPMMVSETHCAAYNHNVGVILTLQVAMLFLTKGPMPHEVLWALWLKQAVGLLPVDCVAASTCGSSDRARLQAVQQACGTSAGKLEAAMNTVPHSSTVCLRSPDLGSWA